MKQQYGLLLEVREDDEPSLRDIDSTQLEITSFMNTQTDVNQHRDGFIIYGRSLPSHSSQGWAVAEDSFTELLHIRQLCGIVEYYELTLRDRGKEF